MSDTNTPENIVPITETAPEAAPSEDNRPKTIQELVASVDLTNVSHHEIITDLIAGIQQLALRATIALGLLERLATDTAEEPAAVTAEDEKPEVE
jgi:hypothetical protein